MSSASFYGWKAKYGSMDVSNVRRLKGRDTENAKLKKLLSKKCMTCPARASLAAVVTT